MVRIGHILCCALLLGILTPVPALAQAPGGRDTVRSQRLRQPVKKGKARRWIKARVHRARHRLHLGRRLKRTRARLLATPAGKRVARLTKKTRRLGRAVRGQLTHLADGLERRLPPGSRRARLFGRVRSMSPMSLGAFSYHKFKRDPMFLGVYKGFSWTLGRAGPPVMLKLGAGVSASLLVPGLIGLPMDLGFILGREHQLRKRDNPDQTLRQTARRLLGDYKTFVHKRRRQNRRYHKVYTRRLLRRISGL